MVGLGDVEEETHWREPSFPAAALGVRGAPPVSDLLGTPIGASSSDAAVARNLAGATWALANGASVNRNGGAARFVASGSGRDSGRRNARSGNDWDGAACG